MKNVVIEFNEQQMQVLNAALVELPYRMASPLIAYINSEVQKNFDYAKDQSDSRPGVVSSN